jgi:hypothetical protein
MAAVEPALTEPLEPADVTARYELLARCLSY